MQELQKELDVELEKDRKVQSAINQIRAENQAFIEGQDHMLDDE